MSDPVEPKVRELKMWLAVRTELPVSVGKLLGQAMHAAGWLHLRVATERPALLQEYLKDATPKIVVSVSSLAALERVEREAEAAGIPHQSVRDAGRSEIEPGTKTVCLVQRHSKLTPFRHEELTPMPIALQAVAGCGVAAAFCKRPLRRFSRSR